MNWLTVLPSIWYFDDHFFSTIFYKKRIDELKGQIRRPKQTNIIDNTKILVQGLIGLLIAYLSYPIVLNLISQNQIMNTSFEPFRIVNTYGAFGSVTKTRTEVVLQGTRSPDPNDPGAEWLEYEFKCKPGSLERRPCLISPYHYRLDWVMWFAAFQNYQSNPWLIHLAGKMLDNDPIVDSLIEENPFRDGDPPKFVRGVHYRYNFSKPETRGGKWWRRRKIGNYFPTVNKESLAGIYEQFGWKD